MRQANSSTLPEDEEEAEEKKHRAGKILITEEDIKKMYSYIELHFGTSYMDAKGTGTAESTDLPWNSCGL